MKLNLSSFCVFNIVIFIAFFPYFSPRRLQIKNKLTNNSPVYQTFDSAKDNKSIPSELSGLLAKVKNVGFYSFCFAEATAKHVKKDGLEERKYQKEQTFKKRRKGKTNRRQTSKNRRNKQATKRMLKNLNKKEEKRLKKDHRQKLLSVLKELDSYQIIEKDEACGTRWARSSVKESNAKFQPHKTYGNVGDSSPSRDNRNRRHISPRTSVAYFSGKSILKKRVNISSTAFTVELWVKPEGGQHDPNVILLAGREINSREFIHDWSIGIKSFKKKHVFYFMKESGDKTSTLIHSSYSYKPEEWTHLTVSSSSRGTIYLYVNGVQVGVRHDQGSTDLAKQGSQYDTLILGGNDKMSHRYRGMVDKLNVWDVERRQPDIKDDIYNFKTFDHSDSILLSEDFDRFEEQWSFVGKEVVKLHDRTPGPENKIHFPEIRAPPCGQTVCDNPEIVRSYVDNWTLRNPKILRYNIVNINEDDGSNPMLTQDDVTRQSDVLKEVFGRHNITWQPTLVHINDSSLRRKTIGCEPEKIGNRQCNRECMHARLGHDGGDCDADESDCDDSKKGNGHCDEECNKIYHGWDSGDCCDPKHTDTDETCFDPVSPYRAYLSVTEYKSLVGADNSKQLSVLFANWTNSNSIGISTFPWDKDVFTSQGGTVVQLRRYTTREEMSGLVHELGHNLGLLHVHHGSHNVDCDDTCAELRASMTTGDLCEDTNPTPMNTRCGEPNGTQAVCRIHNFTRTPYNNFMSYADGSCQDNFTPQQRARMHCYIDLVYSKWIEGHRLPPIPLAPTIVESSAENRSLTLAWAPPIDGKLVGFDDRCDSRCTVNKRFKQYAVNASSPDNSLRSGWSSMQAIGAPDQESCTLRGMHFWMPSSNTAAHMDCGSSCMLNLEFEKSVIPYMLRIWVTYGTDDGDGINSVELLHDDATISTLTELQSSCDSALSLHVKSNKQTKRIRIKVNYPYTAIDAVEMISTENNDMCSGCRGIKYKVHRNPPFQEDLVITTTEQLQFVDDSIKDDITYSYSVQPILHPHNGEISPPVQYKIGQTFCGDGRVQNTNSNGHAEECDDGNLENEDGCDSLCRIEKGFNCQGSPNMCYWHEGDGICEDFENRINSLDCLQSSNIHYVQWVVDVSSSSAAVEALYSGKNRQICPSSKEVVGPPDSACERFEGVWSPCNVEGLTRKSDEHWIKVIYEEPVLPLSISIYTKILIPDQNGREEEFVLFLPDGEEITSRFVLKSCSEKPFTILIPVKSRRTEIKDFILKFRSDLILIDAISLKSERKYDTIEGRHQNIRSGCTISEQFAHSNVNCLSSNMNFSQALLGSSWPNTTSCSITCDSGYLPKSTRKVTCIDGRWDKEVNCVPLSCEAPSHVKFASFSCKHGHKLNAVCNFTCWKQAHMIGDDNTFLCGGDGTWSIPASYCEPRCSLPPSIGFATSGCNALAKTSSRPGETCKYRCKSGYHVTQQPLHKRTFRLTCGADGVWKGPGCQPVLCPPIPTIYKGTYKCTRGSIFGSECSMSCHPSDTEQVTETIRCGSNGQWNASFTLCPDIQTSCDVPVTPIGIEIICDGYNTGQTCRASCVLKEGLSSYDIITLDERDSSIEPNRKIKILVCAGESWFPQPEHLYCVSECDSQFIGDKWCDPINNRAYCGWDGGDCCASTTTGKQVERFPSSCASECDCKDPEVVETNPTMKKSEVESELEIGNRIQLVPVNEAPGMKIAAAGTTQQGREEAEGENDGNESNKTKRKRGKTGKNTEFDLDEVSPKRRQKNRPRSFTESSDKRRRRHRRSKARSRID